MDLIFGRFADSDLAGLSAPTSTLFEALMEWPDTDLYRWVSGEAPAARRGRHAVLRAASRFSFNGRFDEWLKPL